MKNRNLGTPLSKNDMKDVKGGYPPNWGYCVATCGNGATFSACSCASAANFCNFGGGGLAGCSCTGNPQCAD